MLHLPARRWNDIIYTVNAKEGPETITPPLNEEELKEFRRMEKAKKEQDEAELEKYEKGLIKRPCFLIYENVESEW